MAGIPGSAAKGGSRRAIHNLETARFPPSLGPTVGDNE